MSNIIIQSGRVNIEDTNADLGDEIVYNATFDINAKDANDDYLYFPSFASLFLVIVLSVMAVFIFAITALQVGQRFYLLVLKYLISPYAISGLVDPEDQTFSIWCKMVIGDLLTNFIQIFSVYLILYLCNNSTIKSALGSGVFGLCCQIVFFLAGLSAVQQVPSTIARLVGGSGAGAMQALQDIKTIGSASKAVALGGAGIATTVAGVGMGTAGGILSGMGEGISKTSDDDSKLSKAMTIGGSTLKGGLGGAFGTLGKSAMGAYTGYNQRRQFGSAGWQGGKAGITSGASSLAKGVGSIMNTTGGFGSFSSGGNTDGIWFDDDFDDDDTPTSNKNYHNSSTYNDSPTDDQLKVAESLGIEGAENMTRGELSKALEDAGLDETWFNPSNSQKPTPQQLTLAEFYGIQGAENMTYAQLNKELKKAGADIPDPSTTTKKKENISSGGDRFYQDTYNNRKKKMK
ncbi:MAG: hypothetical protein LUG12_12830 [Erysipelotrichaceae bacterium]|nr:hypothetical protein [Erysipelotrichaceae bacterium]